MDFSTFFDLMNPPQFSDFIRLLGDAVGYGICYGIFTRLLSLAGGP
jgi:hypothetical protein